MQLTSPSKTALAVLFAICLGVTASPKDVLAATAKELPRGSYSSLMPPNRIGLNDGGVGNVSDEFYACVATRYGEEFRATMRRFGKRGPATYERVLDVTGGILDKAHYCADQEKGAKINLRRLIQALEAK